MRSRSGGVRGDGYRRGVAGAGVPLVEQAMRAVTPPQTRQQRVMEFIAECYRTPYEEITGPGKFTHIVKVRQISVWLMHKAFPNVSWPYLGRLFGGRDHSTMYHAVLRAEAMMARDSDLKEFTEHVLSEIGVQTAGFIMSGEEIERIKVAGEALRRDLGTDKEWCSQCERRVNASDAVKCEDRFCGYKAQTSA